MSWGDDFREAVARAPRWRVAVLTVMVVFLGLGALSSTADAVTQFVDDLAGGRRLSPGWLLDIAADLFLPVFLLVKLPTIVDAVGRLLLWRTRRRDDPKPG